MRFTRKNSSRRLYAFSGVLVGIFIVQACSRDVPPEAGCNFVQNYHQRRVSWENNLPVKIYTDASVPAEYQRPIQDAINKWNEKGQRLIGKDFFVLRSGNPGAFSPTRDGYSKIYLLNHWEENKSNEQARTTIYWTGTRIYEADIRLNNYNFSFYFGTTPDYNKVHLESLMVHELGHVLGLAHTNDSTSVMQTQLANGTSRDEPSSLDMSSISCEYL